MPKRKHKKYSRPKKIFDKTIILEENNLIKKYGLKNRREVWKASFAVERIRNIAKTLITASEEEKAEFVERQRKKGFQVNTIQDVLALSKEDYLKRRLQSIVFLKKIVRTPKHARQIITHKHVKINNKIINSPSHLTTVEEEATLESDIALPIMEETEEEKSLLNKIRKKE